MADFFASANRQLKAALVFALIALVWAPAGAARAETVVSLTFDDGSVSQLVARDALTVRSMHIVLALA